MSIIDYPVFPFPFLRHTLPSSAAYLDATEEFVFMVVRVPKTEIWKKIGWKSGSAGGAYTIKVSIEAVNETVATPVATTNANKTLYAAGSESADITSVAPNSDIFTPVGAAAGVQMIAGDLVAITIRMIATSSGYVNVSYFVGLNYTAMWDAYCGAYLGGAWTLRNYSSYLTIEGENSFIPVETALPLSSAISQSYNSGTIIDRRGLKFRFKNTVRARGLLFRIDIDSNTDVILYDADEYSVMSGFPITLHSLKRMSTSSGDYMILFPTRPTFQANTWYRLVFIPKTTTAIGFSVYNLADDGSIPGNSSTFEGDDFVYTERAGAPSSGDHAWTDYDYKCVAQLLIDGIDSGGGGVSKSRIFGGF